MLLVRIQERVRTLAGIWPILIMLLANACSARAPTLPQTPVRSQTSNSVTVTGSVSSSTAAREQPIKFDRISLEQGLSQSSVNCILQDRQGFMWFCTQEGLNRYDGYSFKVYRHDAADPNSLSENFVRSITEDASGALWIGTEGGGLDKFDRDAGKFTHYPSIFNFVRVVYQDREGILWIGTTGGGLYTLDSSTERVTRYSHNPRAPDSLSNDYIQTLFEDRQGALWIGMDGGGLDRFDRATGKFAHYQHDPADPSSLSYNAVWAIYEDRSGRLWIGTDGGGLDQLDRTMESPSFGGTAHFTHYQHDPADANSLADNAIRAIYEDQAGALWIGMNGGGLERFDPEAGQFSHHQHNLGDPHSLSDNSVSAIYEDREGVLWVGTAAGGLSKSDRSSASFNHYQALPNDPNSLGHNSVWSIYEAANGSLWIGTSDGLDRFDRSTGQWTHYRHDPSDPDSLADVVVRVVREDRYGKLWIGLNAGKVDQLDPLTGRITHYQISSSDSQRLRDAPVLSIFQDRDGNLLAGLAGGGLHIFDRSTGHFIPYKNSGCGQCLAGAYIRVIYQDRTGTLWIGTAGDGVNAMDPKTGQIIDYPAKPSDPASLSHSLVHSILQDQQGVLWFGTTGGLNRFNAETRTFTRFTEKEGLPNNMVYGILEDGQGYLWLSTNAGLARFDPRTLTFTNYDVSDGLQSNEFNSGAFFKGKSGEMFFGGINGFNAFFPERVDRGNPHVPPVVVTSLTQNGEVVADGEMPVENVRALTLYWPENRFEFEFAALSFAQPGKNQYAYWLENFDRDWNLIGTKRFGRYTNLPGGTYTLWLKGTNNDQVWSDPGASIQITVVPPFWETWWFRGAALLMLIGGVVGGYRLRIKRVETRSRELQTLVAQRTAELQQAIEHSLRAEEALRQSEMDKAVAAERSRLARDLHDVVTQSLFSASLVAEALPTAWQRDPAEGQELLHELRQLTRGALAEMRTLLLELRPAALVEADLGNLLRQLAEALTGREGVPVTATVEGGCALPAPVHIALYRIAQETLNNISKHACAQQVTIELRRGPIGPETSAVELRISDDGCGFDQHRVASDHLGLGIMRERADSIGASLTIESEPGRGTQLTVIWQEKVTEQQGDRHG